jgi:hypothetical protein
LPILHCGKNQRFFLKLIEALAKGGIIAQYNWNAGQDFNGKAWNHEQQPSDAQVIFISQSSS